jgi:glutaminyl-peptide cyclotransferase
VLGGAVVFAATQDFFGAGSSEKRAAPARAAQRFDARRAWRLVRMQLAYGQRPGGSPQLRALAERLRRLLPRGRFEELGPAFPGLRNIVGDLPGRGPPILIGAHYDTQAEPAGFVGANDSAAGTAAVIELARALRSSRARGGRAVRFVLFDGEEQPAGQTDRPFQTSGLRGSRAYVQAHPHDARELVLLDYIAARGSTFRRENDSDPALWARLRRAAKAAGAGKYFPPGDQGVGIVDDTFPFLQQGIPAVDVIDWGYRYKQGTQDTLDKLDPRVLDAVGEAVAELVGRGG